MRPLPVPSPDNAEDGKDNEVEKVIFNNSKVLGRMREMGLTQAQTAEAIGISSSALAFKLKGERYFDQDDIRQLVDVLKVPADQIQAYFFTPEDAKTH